MIFTKGAHQSAKFQTFDCSSEISPNLYFYRFLLLKVCKISAKKVQKSYASWYWRVMQNLKKNRFADKDLVNFDSGTQISKICTVICPFCAKYIVFKQKKCKGVIFNNTEKSCKIWRKTGLRFEKWHEIWQFFTRAHKSPRIGTFIGSKVENVWA